MLGHLLYFQVFLTNPEELPGKACSARDTNLQGPAQLAAVNQLLQGLHVCSQSVEGVLEAEPGVQTEDASVALNGFLNALSFADGAGHRLLAENVLSGIGCFNRHDTVPVGRSGNVNDVYIGVVDEFAEVVVGLHCLVPVLLGSLEGGVQMLLVYVAHGNHSTVLVTDEV